MNTDRANQAERYVLFSVAALLLLLRIWLGANNPQPTLIQARMFTRLLVLAAAAFGGPCQASSQPEVVVLWQRPQAQSVWPSS